MSIDAGAQVTIILLACGPYVVIVDYWDRFCTLGRAPHTNETLHDFREWCRVTRRPRIFHGLTDCQRIPGFWSVTCRYFSNCFIKFICFIPIYYVVNLNIVSSYMLFNYLYIESIDLLQV